MGINSKYNSVNSYTDKLVNLCLHFRDWGKKTSSEECICSAATKYCLTVKENEKTGG